MGSKEDAKLVECPQCDKSFSAVGISVHMRQVHANFRPHICPQCQKSFLSKSHLAVHIKSVHDKIKDIKCELCPFEASLKQTLKSHVKTVHLNSNHMYVNSAKSHFFQNQA